MDGMFNFLLNMKSLLERDLIEMKCKIHKDILPSNPDGTTINDCGNLDLATGGIMTPIILFNADEVENLEFVNDYRFDENLIVETIITRL